MSVEEHKANEEAIFNEFFKVIFKSKFEEDYITTPKNTCYKFIGSLTGTCYNLKSFEELLEECFERIDEYTDRCLEGLPDFYLRSKVDGVPDLAIEVMALEWICSLELKEHKLTIGDIEFCIRANSGNLLCPLLPKEVMKSWNELENELKNIDLEYILDKMNNIEKNSDKGEWLRQNIGNFLEKYFLEKTSGHVTAEIKDNYTFIIKFFPYWENQEYSALKSKDINSYFYIGKIEEFIKKSEKKFGNLTKVKSDKSDKNHHLELLLVEATFIAVEDLKDRVKELYEKLVQRGYSYPIYLVVDSNNSLNRYFIFCINSKTESFNGESK